MPVSSRRCQTCYFDLAVTPEGGHGVSHVRCSPSVLGNRQSLASDTKYGKKVLGPVSVSRQSTVTFQLGSNQHEHGMCKMTNPFNPVADSSLMSAGDARVLLEGAKSIF